MTPSRLAEASNWEFWFHFPLLFLLLFLWRSTASGLGE